MDRRINEEIIIPKLESYRAGMIVYTDSTPAREIIIPYYETSIMVGRILNPLKIRRTRR